MLLVETGDRGQVPGGRDEAVAAVQLPGAAGQAGLVQVLQFSPEVAEQGTLRVRAVLLWTVNTFLKSIRHFIWGGLIPLSGLT